APARCATPPSSPRPPLSPYTDALPISPHRFDDAPDNQAHYERPDEDGQGTDQLAGEAGVAVGDRYQQQAKQTAHTVGRDGADRVVDAQLVQSHDAQYHQQAAQCAPDSGGQCARGGGLGSDHYQAGDGAVQQHGQIGFTEHEAGSQQGADRATGSRCVGVQEHHGDRVGTGDIAQ